MISSNAHYIRRKCGRTGQLLPKIEGPFIRLAQIAKTRFSVSGMWNLAKSNRGFLTGLPHFLWSAS